MSDTGSSGSSEQSPSSTVPSSPPDNVHGNKRPGYYNGADGFQTKRMRVSHFKRPSPEQQLSLNSPPPIVSSTQSTLRSPIHGNPIPKYIQCVHYDITYNIIVIISVNEPERFKFEFYFSEILYK